ncbi:hypothetical protein CVT26_006699 [Gymnopilus dilepis]|uniref:Uncharacterized protein n=1 Tax=Gymnopilus dilepis TaxID=231916 RepID=A0A409WQ97_9AGAR|nr:hypothetical protein CVT26_006699 [Gymnopilus dilepis]
MPSNFNHGSLIDMSLENDGAPWKFRHWQEKTGIPLAADSPYIPAAPSWGKDERAQVHSFFMQYQAKADANAKRAFSTISRQQVPGAGLWRDFVQAGWKTWRINDRITRVLIDTRFHPCILAQYSSDPDKWPDSADVLPQVMDDVAVELFGEEALDGLGRLQPGLRPAVKTFILRTWISIRNKVKAAKKKAKACEEVLGLGL